MFEKKNPGDGEVLRLPMLPQLDAKNLDKQADGGWHADDVGTNYLELIYQNLDIDDVEEDVYAIPDMLKQDRDFSRRLRSPDAALHQPALDAWLGTLCAIAFASGDVVKWVDVLSDAYDEHATRLPYFLRALRKTLLEKSPPIEHFYLYLHRTNDPIAQYVPIAYSYPGLDIVVCPAAEITIDISDFAPPWYRFERYEDEATEGRPVRRRGVFDSPVPWLNQSVFLDKTRALYQGLIQLAQRSPAMEPLMQREVLPKLPEATGVLGGFQLRTDLLPELGGGEGDQPLDQNRILVESWLSNHLCLFDIRPNARPGAQVAAGSFEHCYGDHFVRDKENPNQADCEAVLPLTEAFARYYYSLEASAGQQLLESLPHMLRIERERQPVAEGAKPVYAYLVSLTWQGKVYQKHYREGMYTERSGTEPRHMPAAAVWPALEDLSGKWKHYYFYYAYDSDATWPELSMQVLLPDGGRLRPAWDRNQSLPGARKDFVIPTGTFPRTVSVSVGEHQVGLLLARPAGIVPNVDLRGDDRIIGLDYGTSNTIAYYRSTGAGQESAHAFILPGGQGRVLAVAGIQDSGAAERLTLDFSTLEPLESGLYLSLLHVHGMADEKIAPLEMANVIFAPRIYLDDQMKDHTFLNMKPGNTRADFGRMRAFLSQVIMMYMFDSYCAGCPTIHWRFSYPRSFSPQMLDAYKDSIREVILKQVSYGGNYTVDFRSESESIGSFITAPEMIPSVMKHGWAAVSNSAGYLCMDIGGGTVDFSLFQKGAEQPLKLRADASLASFAGNYILCDTITREQDVGMPPRTSILRELLSDLSTAPEMLEILEELERPGAEEEKLFKRFRMLWATSIQEITAAIQGRHTDLITREQSSLRAYLNMVELYLSMLFFFAGMMVGAAVRENRFAVHQEEKFSILLTGNGARMLELLPEGGLSAFRGSALYNRLILCFHVGQDIKDAGTPQIISPIMPKHEVAYGLSHRDQQAGESRRVSPSYDDGQLANDFHQGRLMPPEPDETQRNLQWVEQNVMNAEGKKRLQSLFDTFWRALEYAHNRTGGNFAAFAQSLFSGSNAHRLSEDTRSIITALDEEENPYANNMAGAFARTARRIIGLIR